MEYADPIIAILGIGTAVPDYRIEQAEAAQRLAEALKDRPDSARWAKRIFKQCGVETRYTCEPNLLESASDCRYLPRTSNKDVPTTEARMETYKRQSVPLGLQAARLALSDGDMDASNITHLITVSCTGQFLPGMDTALVRQLGLAPTVNRIALHFFRLCGGLEGRLPIQANCGRPAVRQRINCVCGVMHAAYSAFQRAGAPIRRFVLWRRSIGLYCRYRRTSP